ncbi:MAG: Hpt domain-containing protein [Ruminococcaceae bacterium]|nr:Hpt domain-containing protein [Oscillospiraceae bacterium]
MNREILMSVGIAYDEAIGRFTGATELFEKFLKEMAIMRVIEPLQKALTEGKTDEAFAIAHTLKGNFGNMSAKTLYEKITPLVDELKNGNLIEAQKCYIELEKEYDIVTDGIKRAM